MLKTIEFFEKLAPKVFRANNNKIVDDGSIKTYKIVMNLSKNLIYMPNIKATKKLILVILDAKKTFNHLK